MRTRITSEQVSTFAPLVVALALSAVVSQVGQRFGEMTGDERDLVAGEGPNSRSVAPHIALPSNPAATATLGTAGLQAEDFDIVRARAVLAASALSGTEKAIFTARLEAAKDRPELLAQVLRDIEVALRG